MDIDFDSIEDLAEYVLNDFKKVIETEGLEKVRDIETEEIQENVYDVYEPTYYKRRYENGGLKDRDNIVTEGVVVWKDGLEVQFTNDTMNAWGTDYLDKFIEEGYKPKDSVWNKPRPFVKPTIDRLKSENVIENVLKDNLDYVD